MKRFIKDIIISFIVLYIYFFSIDLFFTKTIKSSFHIHKGQFALNQKNKNLDYIILGNSRAYHSISAKIINDSLKLKGLNLGIEGVNIANVYLILDDFLKNNNHVEFIFLEISIDKLFLESYDTYSLPEFIPYINNKNIFNAFKDTKGYFYTYSLKYIPFYKYMLYNKFWKPNDIFTSFYKKKYSSGFDNTGSNLINEQFKGKFNYDFKDNKKIKTNIMLDKINNLCKVNNIKLVFFSSPYFNLNVVNNKSTNIYFRFLNKYNRKFLNYTDIFKNKTSFFKDYNHVNKKGAIIITDKIIYELKNEFNIQKEE